MSLQACADLVARADPDRFRATMACPPAARATLFPIYAFNIEVSRAPWAASEPPIAEIRLQWWRDALDEIASWGTVRAHEVSTPLAEVLDAEGAGLLDRLIAARRWDIYAAPFEDEAHFFEYLDATAAGLVWASGRALGAPRTAEAALRDAGWAAGLAAFLGAVPALTALGRQPLPSARAADLRRYAEEGLGRLSSGQAGLASVPKRARAALLAGWSSGAVLRAVKADPSRVADGRTGLSEARKRLMLIWRARQLL